MNSPTLFLSLCHYLQSACLHSPSLVSHGKLSAGRVVSGLDVVLLLTFLTQPAQLDSTEIEIKPNNKSEQLS